MSFYSKAAALGVLVIGFTLPIGATASASEDCERDDYCNPETPEYVCVPDGDDVDSDGDGVRDDEVNCDEGTGDTGDSGDSGDSGEVLPADGGTSTGAPGGAETGDDAEVLPADGGNSTAAPGGAETGGEGETGAPMPGQAGAQAGAPGQAEAAASAAQTAPSGTLPFTGGDVVGLTLIGAGALAVGTVLVLRSRKSAAPTTA